tara:strand:+ start:339 stop:548 length:210 start_codon:yes stop_codon:yes gene_type:complete
MSKELGVGKDGYQKGGVKIKVPSQNMKVDPRAATEVDDPAKDYLPTGDKVKVRGTRRMLSTKNKTATWY